MVDSNNGETMIIPPPCPGWSWGHERTSPPNIRWTKKTDSELGISQEGSAAESGVGESVPEAPDSTDLETPPETYNKRGYQSGGQEYPPGEKDDPPEEKDDLDDDDDEVPVEDGTPAEGLVDELLKKNEKLHHKSSSATTQNTIFKNGMLGENKKSLMILGCILHVIII